MNRDVLKIASEKEHYEDTNRRLRTLQGMMGVLAAMILLHVVVDVLLRLAH